MRRFARFARFAPPRFAPATLCAQRFAAATATKREPRRNHKKKTKRKTHKPTEGRALRDWYAAEGSATTFSPLGAAADGAAGAGGGAGAGRRGKVGLLSDIVVADGAEVPPPEAKPTYATLHATVVAINAEQVWIPGSLFRIRFELVLTAGCERAALARRWGCVLGRPFCVSAAPPDPLAANCVESLTQSPRFCVTLPPLPINTNHTLSSSTIIITIAAINLYTPDDVLPGQPRVGQEGRRAGRPLLVRGRRQVRAINAAGGGDDAA